MDEERDELQEKLRQFFKFKSFKSEDQYYATLAVTSTVNMDIIINLPPASGKSICFQLPTMLCDEKITIVVVPHNYIAKEQISFLKKHNIVALNIHSKFNRTDLPEFLGDFIKNTGIKFIYVTPYVVGKNWFQMLIEEFNAHDLISFIVVDEAHYLSEHFEKSQFHSKIFELPIICPHTIFIALTSVGTENIMTDIKNCLKLKNPREISHSNWQLPNVYLQVKFKDVLDNPFNDIKLLIDSFKELSKEFSGIIYCSTLDETILVAEQLTKLGIPTAPYCLKLQAKIRDRNEEDWMNGKIIMLAVTNTFGMKFNKSSLGCIIHWTVPLKIEQYYQHIGKHLANNPGILCRAYFSVQNLIDMRTSAFGMSSNIFKENEQMIQYCMSTECRHLMLSKYFGISINPCGNACDFCEEESSVRERVTKFQQYMNQRMLLPKLKHTRILQVYNIHKTEVTVKNLKPVDRYNMHEILQTSLLQNYETSSCINKPDIENKYLIHLARGLEYSIFSTSYNQGIYKAKMKILIDAIEKSIKEKKLSSYIFNYKCTTSQ